MKEAWYKQKERGAGRARIYFIWLVYRYLGKSAAKIVFIIPFLFIFPFCGAARRSLKKFYSIRNSFLNGNTPKIRPRLGTLFTHLLSFAWATIDKMDAASLAKDAPRFEFEGDTAWMDGGAFIISSHLGSIEVINALPSVESKPRPKVHAFRQMSHDAVWTNFFARFMDKNAFTLHDTAEIGVGTACEMSNEIAKGSLVLMAGDRVPENAKAKTMPFMGKEALFPQGVFRFAHALECPVYAVFCVRTHWNRYKILSQRLEGDLMSDYVSFLEHSALLYPKEWFHFHDFFL